MRLIFSLMLLLLIPMLGAKAQEYKGVFFGYNYSTVSNIEGIKGWQGGFHMGYAVRGDISKRKTMQLELMAMVEGASSNNADLRLKLAYLKMPLLLNFGVGEESGKNLRLLMGVQPTFYMGGFLKIGHKHYLPRFIREDEETYLQPNFNYFDGGKYAPRNWNMEATIGFESCREPLNYGVRASMGLISNERFQSTSICFRLGF